MGRRAKIKESRTRERRKVKAVLQRRDEVVKVNLKVGYVVRPHDRDQVEVSQDGKIREAYWKHDRQMSEQFIRSALNAKYPQGSNEETIVEMNAEVIDALNQAVIDGTDEIDLPYPHARHVHSALMVWSIPVIYQSHVVRLRKSIKGQLDAHDAAEKAKKNGTEAPVAEAAKT